jgi:hypothetical protein
MLLDDTLRPAGDRIAECRFKQVMAARGFKAGIDRAQLLALVDLVNGTLHPLKGTEVLS